MTSIDDLFKRPNLPTKRKFENPSEADPSQAYKSAKLTSNGDVKQHAQAAVEDAPEDDDDEAGPSLPPDFEDQGLDDDEEGRFFGGGLDENATAAMDYLDKQDAEETYVEQKYDSAWVRKLALNFEKKISKNAELRARYEEEPAKFMGSEADLDDQIKELSILSEHPELYQEFAKLSVGSLVSLLAHDNTDIAIDAIEIISELINEDVEAESEQWGALVKAMIDADLLDLLDSNFSRFDETNEADENGVNYSLTVIEHLASQDTYSERIGKETKILSWLLKRIQKKEKVVSQNKSSAAEILAILLLSPSNRRRVIAKDGIDIALQLIAPYRKRDPENDSDEEEYVANLFNSLICLVEEAEGKVKFVEAEGVELCLLMLKEGKFSKERALKILNHAVNFAEIPSSDEPDGAKTKFKSKDKSKKADLQQDDSNLNRGALVCERLVEAGGLKTIFGMFLKRSDHQTIEHLLSIFAALLRSLPGNSPSRLRVLAKFIEKDYQKVDKLVSLRRQFARDVASEEARIAEDRKGLSADEQELLDLSIDTRLREVGLYSLQTVEVILAWLIAEDGGARKTITKALAERDEGLKDIKAGLTRQLEGIDTGDPERATFKEVLETLISFL